MVLAVGCTSVEKPSQRMLDSMSPKNRAVIEELNPDVVSIAYLKNHVRKYEKKYGEEGYFCAAIVKGIVTDVEEYELPEELIEQLKQEEADLYESTGVESHYSEIPFYYVYLDNDETPLKLHLDQYPPIIGMRYYFIVSVEEFLKKPDINIRNFEMLSDSIEG